MAFYIVFDRKWKRRQRRKTRNEAITNDTKIKRIEKKRNENSTVFWMCCEKMLTLSKHIKIFIVCIKKENSKKWRKTTVSTKLSQCEENQKEMPQQKSHK